MGLLKATQQKTETETIVVGAVCDNCGAELKSATPSTGWHWSNILDALWVSVDGGYGMYIDNDSAVQVLFCKECAGKLMEAFPSIRKKYRGEVDANVLPEAGCE